MEIQAGGEDRITFRADIGTISGWPLVASEEMLVEGGNTITFKMDVPEGVAPTHVRVVLVKIAAQRVEP